MKEEAIKQKIEEVCRAYESKVEGMGIPVGQVPSLKAGFRDAAANIFEVLKREGMLKIDYHDEAHVEGFEPIERK